MGGEMVAELDMILRLLLSAVLGAVIGYQRERAGKQAGLRTNTLICVGAALFTVVSIYGFDADDTARVAAGVVAGIGFLGAGAIIRGRGCSCRDDHRRYYLGGRRNRPGGWRSLYAASAVATAIILAILLIPHSIGK